MTPHLSRELWTSCSAIQRHRFKDHQWTLPPCCTSHSCFLSPWLTRKALSWCYGSIMSPPRRDWAHVNTCDETVRRCRLAAGSSRRCCCCCRRPWVWLRAEIVKVTRVRTLFGQERYENMQNYLVELFVSLFFPWWNAWKNKCNCLICQNCTSSFWSWSWHFKILLANTVRFCLLLQSAVGPLTFIILFSVSSLC